MLVDNDRALRVKSLQGAARLQANAQPVEPAKPGAQMAQAETDALPAPAVVMPVGHAVQDDEPAAEYEPAGQMAQPAAAAVPAPVTLP